MERLSFFTVMVSRMIELDLTRFVTVGAIYVAGFSAVLLILLGSETPKELSSFTRMATAPISAVLGLEDLSFVEEPIAKYAVIMHMVINSVLVLNLLIAVMGDTYFRVSANKHDKHALWRKLRVRAVLTLDRLMIIPGMRKRFLGKNIIYDASSDVWYIEVCTSEDKHSGYSDTPWGASVKSLKHNLYFIVKLNAMSIDLALDI